MPYMGQKGVINKESNTYNQGKSGAKQKVIMGPSAGGGLRSNPSKKGGVFRAVKNNSR